MIYGPYKLVIGLNKNTRTLSLVLSPATDGQIHVIIWPARVPPTTSSSAVDGSTMGLEKIYKIIFYAARIVLRRGRINRDHFVQPLTGLIIVIAPPHRTMGIWTTRNTDIHSFDIAVRSTVLSDRSSKRLKTLTRSASNGFIVKLNVSRTSHHLSKTTTRHVHPRNTSIFCTTGNPGQSLFFGHHSPINHHCCIPLVIP